MLNFNIKLLKWCITWCCNCKKNLQLCYSTILYLWWYCNSIAKINYSFLFILLKTSSHFFCLPDSLLSLSLSQRGSIDQSGFWVGGWQRHGGLWVWGWVSVVALVFGVVGRGSWWVMFGRGGSLWGYQFLVMFGCDACSLCSTVVGGGWVGEKE